MEDVVAAVAPGPALDDPQIIPLGRRVRTPFIHVARHSADTVGAAVGLRTAPGRDDFRVFRSETPDNKLPFEAVPPGHPPAVRPSGRLLPLGFRRQAERG